MAYGSQGIVAYWSTTSVLSSADANKIGQVTGFNGPNQSAAVIDVTNLASTAKEKLVGVYDGGQISFNLNWAASNAGQLKVQKCFKNRTKGSINIELTGSVATGKTVFGEGYVTGLNITGAVDNKVSGDVT